MWHDHPAVRMWALPSIPAGQHRKRRIVIKASDLLIARRADTKARADFSTWRMMAKLKVASSLPSEAQEVLAEFDRLCLRMDEARATEATIEAIYRRYYAEMGGAGTPPDSAKVTSTRSAAAVAGTASRTPADGAPTAPADNVISLREQKQKQNQQRAMSAAQAGRDAKPRLPVALIFIGLIIVTVGLHYLLK